MDFARIEGEFWALHESLSVPTSEMVEIQPVTFDEDKVCPNYEEQIAALGESCLILQAQIDHLTENSQ